MEDTGFKDNIKLEVAVEIISTKIAELANHGFSIEDKELQMLIKEREKMYSGDKKTIDKILNIYGAEIKNG